jgi:outer membrane protein assembly factor BamB
MLEDNVRTLRHEPAVALDRAALADPHDDLRALLFGGVAEHELPPLPDLIAAAMALASGLRRKALLPLRHTPAELALVRMGEQVSIDFYGTDSAPELLSPRREVPLIELLRACSDAASRVASGAPEHATSVAIGQLGDRLSRTELRRDPNAGFTTTRCTGGSLASPGTGVPLAFGFAADIAHSSDAAQEPHAFADVHALLFEGTLWAFVGGRRVTVAEGPVMLVAQRMVAAVRALVEAWQAERNVHVRLRSGAFWIAVRRERDSSVALTLGGGGKQALTWPVLSVRDTALPILRLGSDVIRKLIGVDRRQTHNLRVKALRAEIRALRRIIRACERLQSIENEDPERLRLSSPELTALSDASTASEAAPEPPPRALRYTERWTAEIDGLDAGAVHLCGERLVLATQKLTLALSRAGGEVLWSHPTLSATSFMLGRTLLRLLPDGELLLHETEQGSVYARTRLSARGVEGPALYAAGPSVPPMAILAEAREHLCAIDLRTGQPRWRFRVHGHDTVHAARGGRVLCVTSGDGTVDALDVATGELAWRFGERVRFCLQPLVCGEVVVAVAGEPRGGAGAVFGIDLWSGKRLWQRDLPAAPSCDPVDAGSVVIVPHGRSRQAKLLALEPRTGSVRWRAADPGLDNGGQALALDGSLIVNAPSGRALALDLQTGDTRWSRALSNPLTDDVPRQLEPMLRQGALFLPSAQVHVLRPSDGTPLGQLSCDLVPDCLRVDERGWLYVAEESGHLCAYATAPHLSLVR